MTAVHGEPRPANLEQGWTVDDSTFGARLALIRQRMRWNIKEAARECGIPAASWGTWENGAMPRRYTEMCQLIANRTGADLAWLAMGPGLKKTLGSLNDQVRNDVIRPTPKGVPLPQRRDSVRPTSAIPATRRRPVSARPPNRPVAA